MIKNFIFDMGNVLMDFSPDYILAHYTHDIHEIKDLKAMIFGSSYWLALDNGDITFDDAKRQMIADAPLKYHHLISDVIDTWQNHKVPRIDMLNIIKELKDRGYDIYLCSNAAGLFHTYKDKYEVFQYFDDLLISADIHISKPDLEIYQYVLDKNKLKANECLFVDDLSINVKAAENVGMYGYQYNGNAELFKLFLEAIGIL